MKKTIFALLLFSAISLSACDLVVRINDNGLYLHDIVNIKKEDSKPFES